MYLSTGKFEQAEEVCNKALQLDSTLSQIWDNLAKIYMNTGRLVQS
ncbi:MAG: hypothetical protein IPM34_13010 [Saprospiraceae bacterium]|nr:hypothetical protein [Saprospiraceae bacterium]